MQTYTMKLVTKSYGGSKSRPCNCIEFQIPDEYCNPDDYYPWRHWNMLDTDPSARLITINPEFCSDYCYLESLKVGNYYNLVFINDLGHFGTWFVLDIPNNNFDDDLQMQRALNSSQN